MNKHIKFEDIPRFPMRGLLGSSYSILHRDESGRYVVVHEFDSEDLVVTTCPGCGGPTRMTLASFFDIAASEDFDLYSTMIYCPACCAKRANK